MTKAPLIILSGPSGSGKTTVAHRLRDAGEPPLHLAISATTRQARPDEENGRDYHFWTEERFQKGIAAGEFLEHAKVHGHYYGTLKQEVDSYRERGVGVLLVIDVQGAALVRAQYPDAVTIFLNAPSHAVLEQRLRDRQEPEASIQTRLANATGEEARSGEYQHKVINDDLDQTVERVRAVIRAYFR